MQQTYYYVYRERADSHETINWDEPTGGLVLPTADTCHAMDIARERYHTAPYEELIIAEVWEDEKKWTATLLHKAWDVEMRTWLESASP